MKIDKSEKNIFRFYFDKLYIIICIGNIVNNIILTERHLSLNIFIGNTVGAKLISSSAYIDDHYIVGTRDTATI